MQGLLYFCVINKEGDTLSNQNKIKYDSAYISYVANGESAAVFIVRDVVRSIDTSGMWIDVISTSGHKNKFDKWDFSSITIEKICNKKFERYVPKHWARSSDCEVHIKKVPIQPAWEYYIISIKRL